MPSVTVIKDDTSVIEIKKSYRTRETSLETIPFYDTRREKITSRGNGIMEKVL